ncbi:MAG: hypothetical protein E6J34_23080 [Chloroflexi bacterium]|nr:MAG: hypothetical protein E6J34_23080 [Chloroflexota bacterium]
MIAIIKSMMQRYPDLEDLLIPLSEPSNSVDPEAYRRQVEKAFRRGGYGWGADEKVARDLSHMVTAGDQLAEQQRYADAFIIYDTVMQGIMEEDEQYREGEGDLHVVIADCVDALSTCLAQVQDDHVLREKMLALLFSTYIYDIKEGGIGFAEEAPAVIVEQATAEERKKVVWWLLQELAATASNFQKKCYGKLLLELKGNEVDDDEYLRLCSETGLIHDMVERLLSLGRVDDAIKAASTVSDYNLLALMKLFLASDLWDAAERIMRDRAEKTTDTRIWEWLTEQYSAHKNYHEALKFANKIFRNRPDLREYQNIRLIASQLQSWDTVREELLAFLNKQDSTGLLIAIALDEDDVDRALELYRAKPRLSYYYNGHNLIHDIARVAEEKRPLAAIDLYQRYAEHLITGRSRESYRQACDYLKKAHDLYEKLGQQAVWSTYISSLMDKNRTLRALKEEINKAHLI